MSKKNIERLIPDAINVAREILADNGTIQKEYNSYISSFGASISQAGLSSTIAFFKKTDASSNADRKKVITSIEKLLAKGEIEKLPKKDILDAAVALKLAIRTFELSKDNKWVEI